MHIRKGDTVLVLSGKDRGKTGKVLRGVPSAGRVVVEGVNVLMRHRRARGQQKGQRISAPMAIDRSNVMMLCPHCAKPARISIRRTKDHTERVCKRCNEVIA